MLDHAAGTVLWDDGSVGGRDLGLPPETVERMEAMCRWHDTSLDGDGPAGASPWDGATRIAFDAEADRLLAAIRRELVEVVG